MCRASPALQEKQADTERTKDQSDNDGGVVVRGQAVSDSVRHGDKQADAEEQQNAAQNAHLNHSISSGAGS
jgi:hypothetical protein